MNEETNEWIAVSIRFVGFSNICIVKWNIFLYRRVRSNLLDNDCRSCRIISVWMVLCASEKMVGSQQRRFHSELLRGQTVQCAASQAACLYSSNCSDLDPGVWGPGRRPHMWGMFDKWQFTERREQFMEKAPTSSFCLQNVLQFSEYFC